MIVARLMLRRNRLLIGAWSVLLIALSGGTASAYQTTYATPQQRAVATRLAQHNPATTLLYGNLADPGTPAQMFSWEIGAIATILAAILAVLVAISITRATEDDGTLELLRSSGIDARVPLRSALAVLTGVAAVLASGCAAGAGLSAGQIDAFTWPGAAAFGAVIGLTFLIVGMLVVVIAQLAPATSDARTLGLAAIGLAFGIRAVADTQHLGWLNWLSPLGLRATVQPFAGNHGLALLAGAAEVLALAGLATMLSARREYGSGLLRRADLREGRLAIRSSFGLAGHLARPSVLSWMVAVACLATLFSAMGSGIVQQSQDGDLGGFLGSQLGTADPIAGYFAYSGVVVGIAVSAFAILTVLITRQEELGGLTDHARATGVRRWEPLAAQLAVAAAGSAVILLAAGVLGALVAPRFIAGPDVSLRAIGYIVGQWPAAMAVAGWTALLAGLRPRLAGLAWVPLLGGAALALLGQLLGVPRSIRNLGIFQHVPDIASTSPSVRGLAVLLAVAAGTCVLGLVGTTRRDLSTG